VEQRAAEALEPARRALAKNPADAEAKIRLKVARLTLPVAYVASGHATLGWLPHRLELLLEVRPEEFDDRVEVETRRIARDR